MQTAKDLIELCKDKHVTVSSCESLTAGLFTSTLASIPGASAVLKGGFVTYFTEMKQVMAHVEKDLIDTFGVVSGECAKQMAQNTREITQSDYCVSFTGNAGPDAMEVYHFQYQGLERNELRMQVVQDMINNLAEIIMKE